MALSGVVERLALHHVCFLSGLILNCALSKFEKGDIQ